jgi:hypothetical protein
MRTASIIALIMQAARRLTSLRLQSAISQKAVFILDVVIAWNMKETSEFNYVSSLR